jgi:hypothetical protein
MRRWSVFFGTALLAIALSGVAGAADPEESSATSTSWWSRMFKSRAAKKREADAKKKKHDEALIRKAALEGVASQLAREEADWVRRIQVCQKLREIASVNNDPELNRRADMLDQRAWELYQKRTAKLSSGRAGQSPDEQALQQHLDVNAGAHLLSETNSGNNRQAALREGQR